MPFPVSCVLYACVFAGSRIVMTLVLVFYLEYHILSFIWESRYPPYQLTLNLNFLHKQFRLTLAPFKTLRTMFDSSIGGVILIRSCILCLVSTQPVFITICANLCQNLKILMLNCDLNTNVCHSDG